MSTPERIRRELTHPRQHRSLADEFDSGDLEMRRIVVESILKSAPEVLKQCSVQDVLALALTHPAVRDEIRRLGVQVDGTDVGFASRDFPASIQGYILDKCEEHR